MYAIYFCLGREVIYFDESVLPVMKKGKGEMDYRPLNEKWTPKPMLVLSSNKQSEWPTQTFISVRILLCQKYDLKPDLGSGLPGRWWRKPTLPGSRVTRRAWRLATLAWRKWRSRKKTFISVNLFPVRHTKSLFFSLICICWDLLKSSDY